MEDDSSPLPKYYKMRLDPNYKPEMISDITRKFWEKFYCKKLQESKESAPFTAQDVPHCSYQQSPEDFRVSSSDEDELQEVEDFFDNYDQIDGESSDEGETEPLTYEPAKDGSSEDKATPNEDMAWCTEDGNKIMFEKSGITINDVLQMIVAYGVRFGITQQAREFLIYMFKTCAGSEFNDLKISNYKISQIFDPPSDKLFYNFYCDKCPKKDKVLHSSVKSSLKGQKVNCENCQTECTISLSNPNFFVIIDLEYQLKLLMQSVEVAKAIVQKLQSDSNSISEDCIRDIDDSELYKHIKVILTYNLSTDGAPLFHITKRGFWPLQILLNFLPVPMRFKYVLLAGIMVLLCEPKPDLMNLFIQEFNQQVTRLLYEGIRVKLPSYDDEVTLRFSPMCVVADSVARPILQNRYQYNGYSSCGYCYHGGQYIKKAGIRFPFLEQAPELRTHNSHMQDVAYTLNNGKHVRGVKGESAFNSTPNVDMVWGFPPDYMHNAILGVTEQIWTLMKEKALSAGDQRTIDELILLIQPSHDLRRHPQKLSNKGVWKATHWKSWLLYYSLPILSRFLPGELLEHYALFVKSIHTLLKSEISEDELKQCEEDLIVFVAKYQTLYGVERMTFNIHILLHLVTSVRLSGPLWSTSAFPFENNIYCLKQTINGPKSVEQQMAIKSLVQMHYKVRPRNPALSEKAAVYCQNLFNSKTITKSAVKIGDVTLFGPSLRNRFQKEQEYERCIFGNCVYSSNKYSRSTKFNDTVVQLKSGKIVQIAAIAVTSDNKINFEIKELIVEPFFAKDTAVPHILKVIKNVDHVPISTSDIMSKAVVLDFTSEQYVCVIPNNIEPQ